MKTKICLAGILLAAALADAQTVTRSQLVLASNTPVILTATATNDLNSTLQRGLFEEEGNRDLTAAISAYQSLVGQFDQSRPVAATAIFRLGECYRKQGRTNEAVAQYERITRGFADQQTLVTLSRQNMAGLKKQVGETFLGGDLRVEELRQEYANVQRKWERIKYVKSNHPESLSYVLADEDDELKSLLSLRKEKEIRLASLKQAYSVEHPEVKVAQAEVAATALMITNRTENVLFGYQVRLDSIHALLANLENETATQSGRTVDDEDKEIRRLQTMLQDSPDLINSSAGGSTPLIEAATVGQIRVVTFLLDHGADINLKAGGRAALHGAAGSGNKAMVELLLNRGADVNTTDGTGGTALHIAAEKGFRSVAEVLLAHHANINAPNADMNDAQTSLHRAAALGNVEMMKLLLTHGADVNVRSKSGSTPLKVAVGPAKLESLKTLLAAGANPNLADNQGVTPLSDAASAGNLEAVKLLLDAKADPNAGTFYPPLFCAIRSGSTNLVELLLRAGADPNLPGRIEFERSRLGGGSGGASTNLPLEFACSYNQPEIVRLLLQFKADPNGTDLLGQPFIFQGLLNLDILKILLEAGADANAVESPSGRIARPGETPLLMAARNRFIRSSARPDRSYEISREGDLAAARLLIDHGANVNARRPSDGATPLHAAVGTDNRELVELLLASKADVNAGDNQGKNALDWTKQRIGSRPPNKAETDTVELLLKYGAVEKSKD